MTDCHEDSVTSPLEESSFLATQYNRPLRTRKDRHPANSQSSLSTGAFTNQSTLPPFKRIQSVKRHIHIHDQILALICPTPTPLLIHIPTPTLYK